MSKYQKSLDRLSTLKNGFWDSAYSGYTSSYEPINEDCIILQELINNYEELMDVFEDQGMSY